MSSNCICMTPSLGGRESLAMEETFAQRVRCVREREQTLLTHSHQLGKGGTLPTSRQWWLSRQELVKICLFEGESWHSGNQASWPFSLAPTSHADLLAGAGLSTPRSGGHTLLLAPGREIITAC